MKTNFLFFSLLFSFFVTNLSFAKEMSKKAKDHFSEQSISKLKKLAKGDYLDNYNGIETLVHSIREVNGKRWVSIVETTLKIIEIRNEKGIRTNKPIDLLQNINQLAYQFKPKKWNKEVTGLIIEEVKKHTTFYSNYYIRIVFGAYALGSDINGIRSMFQK